MELLLEWGGALFIIVGYWRFTQMDVHWGAILSLFGCAAFMAWSAMMGYPGMFILNGVLFCVNVRGFVRFLRLPKETDLD